MKHVLLSILVCMASNLISQRTARPNPYIAKNISCDSDPENKKINRLNNLKGEVSHLTSYVYSVARGNRKVFDKQKSFKYSFNKDAVIDTACTFKQVDQLDQIITYQSFIRNRKTQIDSHITEGQVNTMTYVYDDYNRLVKTISIIDGEITEVVIPVIKGDSLDHFHIDGKIYKYEDGRLMFIDDADGSSTQRYIYRRDKTLARFENYIESKAITAYGYTASDGRKFDGVDGVGLRPNGLVNNTWDVFRSASGQYEGAIGIFYTYNDYNQVIQKQRHRQRGRYKTLQVDSTKFAYVYNDDKLLTSIIKDGNELKPMVIFDYNQHGDMIYSKSPAGEVKYTYDDYDDYDDFNNWRSREKYLNGVLTEREERKIGYYD